jgi:hypothetical protein
MVSLQSLTVTSYMAPMSARGAPTFAIAPFHAAVSMESNGLMSDSLPWLLHPIANAAMIVAP